VTGGSRGLGLQIAEALVEMGARVALAARKRDELDAAVAHLAALYGVEAVPLVCDLSDPAAVAPMVARAEAALGPIDILVNNAGIQRRGPLVDFKEQDWDDIIATNLTAPFVVSQAVVRGMMGRKSGKVIHIASLMSDLARPTVVPYTAAKGGVRQLTRGMAIELAPHNIQVNAISPGYFATEMNRALIDNVEFNAWVCKRTPAGRWGEPSEIAGLAVFLSSAAANYITGQLITIDGGMSVSL
jgi:gluconate 5-dehydrogenase